MLRKGALALALASCVAAGVFAWEAWRYASTPARPGAEAIVLVARGQSPAEISRALGAANVIENPDRLLWFGKLTRRWAKVKAGEYRFASGLAPSEVFDVLSSGVSVAYPTTIREGQNIYEVADSLENKGLARKADFLTACRDPGLIRKLGFGTAVSLEGYLFPDTYSLTRQQSIEDIVRQMTRHFESVWSPELEARASELGMNRHQVVTLASIVEKETGDPRERPLIASVFHNRLRKRMRLASDPSTIYGIWERYRGNLRRDDLQEKTPYNTYRIPALPVGPIGNPGREALLAALHPAESPYLFFVSRNDGTHEFTVTYAEHSRAVARFQKDPKAREGKSWRDLKK